MTQIGAGLEQIGAAGAEIGDAEIGPAAGQRKADQRIRRKPVISADGGPKHAACRIVGAESRIAIRGLRAAEACGPHAPALRQRLR